MNVSDQTIIHLKTQRDQPYGSVRRCCEQCGIMIWGPSNIHWTDNPVVYDNPPPEFIRCDDSKRN